MSEHWVYGVHAVKALIANDHRQIYTLFVNKERSAEPIEIILEQAKKRKIAIQALSAEEMQQRFAAFVHQGVVASASAPTPYQEADLPLLLEKASKPALILILDGLTDPHNLGACLRVADATGVDFVMMAKDKTATITPVVSKVASGAVDTVPLVRVTNLVRSMDFLKAEGVWIYGAAGEATQSLYQMDCTTSVAFVLGREGEGLRRLTREHCDGLFSLPMLGSVDSLNVSVATGVALYEVVRQRR
jgi:23S rRNA (guanosine2251-2'-O)-methyltransferase